eukprot:TRINITY_DN1990_c0_g1_i2.p1 TRINITY_DN1990_c0_g1~~TRINITY_DN1990_c0_g1_i2.p1  ORF type:complete len:496 (-),score=104.60 TRINITY_DN1990_c0_g1_i2:67-1554(-)
MNPLSFAIGPDILLLSQLFGPDQKFLEARKLGLQKLVDALVFDPELTNCVEVTQFLAPPALDPMRGHPTYVPFAGSPTYEGVYQQRQSPVPHNNGGGATIAAPPITHDHFAFPMPPPGLVIPQHVASVSGERCFVHLLLDDARTHLKLASALYATLSEIDDPEIRMVVLEDSRNQIATLMSSLNAASESLSRLIHGTNAIGLKSYYNCIRSATQQSTEWVFTLDMMFPEKQETPAVTATPAVASPLAAPTTSATLQPQPTMLQQQVTGSAQKIPQPNTVGWYVEKAEKAVLVAVSATEQGTATATQEALATLYDTKSTLDNAISRFQNLSDTDPAKPVARLASARQQVVETIAMLQTRGKDPEQQVEALGQELFAVLGNVSTLEAESSAPDDDQAREEECKKLQAMHEHIMKLMHDMHSCHIALEKHQAPSHVIRVLEDYQENVADLEHDFTSKHPFVKEGSGGLKQKASSALKERTVNVATQANLRAYDEIFEL